MANEKPWSGRKWGMRALLLLIWLIFEADARNVVRTLPGYNGDLPFKLETGYVGVGINEEIQLFYYFIESERDPVNDPLFLWLTGGPGCSGLSGILYEIGPVQFDYAAYNGSLPSLIPNPYAFTKVASVIFIDAPIGTGFSYSSTNDPFPITEISTARSNYQFLQKWLSDHPNFLKNSLYIVGDSYSGITVPILVQEIHKGREARHEPEINLHGYILGNPLTIRSQDFNTRVPFAHHLSLLSDELFESARSNCNGDYLRTDVDNTACIRDLKAVNACMSAVFSPHVLEPACPWSVTDNIPDDILIDGFQGKGLWCRNFSWVLASRWANNPKVQEALHVRIGTKDEWKRCNYSIPFGFLPSVFEYHQSFLNTSYRALVYSGDHDYLVPYVSTMAWIRSLNLTVTDSWKPWFFDGRAGGFTEAYKERNFSMTFATVLGGGHTAPEYRPKPCLKMVERWLTSSDIDGAKLSYKGTADYFM